MELIDKIEDCLKIANFKLEKYKSLVIEYGESPFYKDAIIFYEVQTITFERLIEFNNQNNGVNRQS